jgi:hypothetical protein
MRLATSELSNACDQDTTVPAGEEAKTMVKRSILELADTEGIGETGWTPPPRQAFWMAERGKDLL